MKDLNLIVWLSQLGISVTAPLAGFILLAVWLNKQYNLGDWVIWVGIVLGVIGAISGFRSSLQILNRISRKDKEDVPPAVSFNDHD